MAAHVAERAVAEIPPPPPGGGDPFSAVRPLRGGAEPGVVVQAIGHRDDTGGGSLYLRAPVLVYENMRLAHRPDRAGANQLDDTPEVLAGMDVGAELRDALGFRRRLGHPARFEDVMRQRFFRVHVTSRRDRHQRRRSVGVIGRGGENGIEAFLRFQHFPEIRVLPGLRADFSDISQVVLIDVADRDDAGGFQLQQLIDVGTAAVVCADDGNRELLARRRGAQDVAARRNPNAGGYRGADFRNCRRLGLLIIGRLTFAYRGRLARVFFSENKRGRDARDTKLLLRESFVVLVPR